MIRTKAYFWGRPDADAAARALRDLGFATEVMPCDEESYEETVKEFFTSGSGAFKVHAELDSDADIDSFEEVVRRHNGRVVGGAGSMH